MTKKNLVMFSALILTIASFSYGLYVGNYKTFPYTLIHQLIHKISPKRFVNKDNYRTDDSIVLFEYLNTRADLVFVGDSITADGLWSEIFPKLKIANRGVGGDKTSDILRRIESITSTEPRYALIMAGINDLRSGNSIKEILWNYERIIDNLKISGINVIVQSTIQCEKKICGSDLVHSINELNTNLQKLAYTQNINYVDLERLSKNEGIDSIHSIDGFHLSANGYIYWSKKISSYLSEIE